MSTQALHPIGLLFYKYTHYIRRVTDTIGILLSDVSRLLRRRFDERARATGATSAQWKVLLSLSRNEGINQGGLADLLEVEPITLCRMIDRLSDAGLVERRRHPSDRRAWRIFLTDRSRPLIEDLRGVAADLTGQALAGLAPPDIAALTVLLNRIRDNLSPLPKPKEIARG
jgi:DNA-binding MarR family transcriptional regulator